LITGQRLDRFVKTGFETVVINPNNADCQSNNGYKRDQKQE